METLNRPVKLSPWPFGIAFAFLIVISVNMYFLWQSIQTPHELVAKDYYAQSLAYEQVIQAEALTAKNQWQFDISYRHQGQNTLVSVNLKDKEQTPISGVQGSLVAYRPSDVQEDAKGQIQEVSVGRYETSLPSLSSGLWEIKMMFTDSNDTLIFYKKYRLHIMVDNPS